MTEDLLTVTGIVLSAEPAGEYDRRLLLLTRELGKISAFVSGARRPNHPLVGLTAFSFGSFELREGRSAYSVKNARIQEHFSYLSDDPLSLCYAAYFAELCTYYSRENVDGSRLLKLLCFAVYALKQEALPRELVRRIFEIKALQSEGEYFPQPRTQAGDSARYAWQFILTTPPEKLFSFTLDEQGMKELSTAAEDMKNEFIDREFHSLKVLEDMTALLTSP